jgi:uncharacterized protein
MLRRAGIGFGVIAVLSDLSQGAAGDLYRFACELGCDRLGVNLAEKKGVYTGGQEDSGADAVAFWQELTACLQADPRLRIRELDHAYTYVREELAGTAVQRASRPVSLLPLVTWDGHFLPVGPEQRASAHPASVSSSAGTMHCGRSPTGGRPAACRPDSELGLLD